MARAPVDPYRHPGALPAKSLLCRQFRIAHALLDDMIDRLAPAAWR
jgi:hypothetical protein